MATTSTGAVIRLAQVGKLVLDSLMQNAHQKTMELKASRADLSDDYATILDIYERHMTNLSETGYTEVRLIVTGLIPYINPNSVNASHRDYAFCNSIYVKIDLFKFIDAITPNVVRDLICKQFNGIITENALEHVIIEHVKIMFE